MKTEHDKRKRVHPAIAKKLEELCVEMAKLDMYEMTASSEAYKISAELRVDNVPLIEWHERKKKEVH